MKEEDSLLEKSYRITNASWGLCSSVVALCLCHFTWRIISCKLNALFQVASCVSSDFVILSTNQMNRHMFFIFILFKEVIQLYNALTVTGIGIRNCYPIVHQAHTIEYGLPSLLDTAVAHRFFLHNRRLPGFSLGTR